MRSREVKGQTRQGLMRCDREPLHSRDHWAQPPSVRGAWGQDARSAAGSRGGTSMGGGLWRRDRNEMTPVFMAPATERRSQHLLSLVQQCGVTLRLLGWGHLSWFLGNLSLGRVLDI